MTPVRHGTQAQTQGLWIAGPNMKLEAMTPHLARASLQSKTFRRASRPISRNALASGFFVQIQPQSQEKETGR